MEWWQTLLLTIAAVASPIAAVLSWTVKLRWSEEERRAKEAQIALVEAQAREALRQKDATIEALKQQNDTLKLFNYKEAREQLLAARQLFEEAKAESAARLVETQRRHDELAFQARHDREYMAKLDREQAAEVALISDMLDKLSDVPAVQEYLEKLADAIERGPTVVFSRLNLNAAPVSSALVQEGSEAPQSAPEKP